MADAGANAATKEAAEAYARGVEVGRDIQAREDEALALLAAKCCASAAKDEYLTIARLIRNCRRSAFAQKRNAPQEES